MISTKLAQMKSLHLVRHAKSSWEYPTLDDFDRPLNSRGEKNAHELGKLIKELRIEIECIWSSPAKRAKQTSMIIVEENKLSIHCDKSLYNTDCNGLRQFVNCLDDNLDSILIVGHEPSLSSFTNHFLTKPLPKLVTASLTSFKFETRSWKDIHRNNISTIFHRNRHYWQGSPLQ